RGSDAGADVFPDRRVGRRPAVVRGHQIFPVHAGRVGTDASRDPGDLLLPQYFRRARDSGPSLPRAGWLAAEVVVLGILFRVCNQGASVPVPHMAAGRAHRGTDGWFRHPGWRAAENGDLRISAIFTSDVSGRNGEVPRDRDRSLADWNYLRRAGLHDAEGHEKAHRVFVGEPHGFLYAGNFRADAAGAFRQHHPASQSRHIHRRVVPAGRRAVRAAAHTADFRFRWTFDADAEFRSGVFDYHAQLAG